MEKTIFTSQSKKIVVLVPIVFAYSNVHKQKTWDVQGQNMIEKSCSQVKRT